MQLNYNIYTISINCRKGHGRRTWCPDDGQTVEAGIRNADARPPPPPWSGVHLSVQKYWKATIMLIAQFLGSPGFLKRLRLDGRGSWERTFERSAHAFLPTFNLQILVRLSWETSPKVLNVLLVVFLVYCLEISFYIRLLPLHSTSPLHWKFGFFILNNAPR